MGDLAITTLAGSFLVGCGALWSWALRFALEATTGTVLPWRAAVMVTLLLFAVAKPINVDSDAGDTLGDVMARMVPFGVLKPLLIVAAAWCMTL
jgi:hypothetical protein